MCVFRSQCQFGVSGVTPPSEVFKGRRSLALPITTPLVGFRNVQEQDPTNLGVPTLPHNFAGHPQKGVDKQQR